LSEFEVTVRFASPKSKHKIKPVYLSYPVEKSERPKVLQWVERLLDRSYGQSQRQKRIKLLVNPFGGQGQAQRLYTKWIEPVLQAANCVIDVEATKYKGHAVDIAERLDIEQYDVVACCSGDGLPHEVFNGFGNRHDAKKALAAIAVFQLPCGSGNAASWNLTGTDSPSLAALACVKGLRTKLDLASVTQGDRRILTFLSQAVGVVAELDLGTENMRWMGNMRFTVGFLIRILGKTVYPCDVAIKVAVEGNENIRTHHRTRSEAFTHEEEHEGEGLPPLEFGTVNDKLPEGWEMTPYPTMGNFYCGNVSILHNLY
jgi:sphingosine kinase